MSEKQNEFTVKFGKIARTLDYNDPEGHLVFTFDRGPGGDKSICLEHHAPRKQSVPRYSIAFERAKEFLESCDYQVEIHGSVAGLIRVEASEITALINSELAGASQSLKTCFKLGECLIPPSRITLKSNLDNDTWNLWLVLEERTVTKDGYKIVFDEHSKQFGAAKGMIFLGFEGTFIQTLEAISGVA
jgi:hypothetical protein